MSDGRALTFLPYGEHAVLIEVASAEVAALRSAVLRVAGVREAVAGAETVLAVFDPAITNRAQVQQAIERLPVEPTVSTSSTLVEIRVDYDGPDLAGVSRDTGLSIEEVVARHCGGEYVVRFCGFSPGFAYLDGLHPALRVRRHSEPRTLVPAGSVAIAGDFAGVYPRSSPGGWQLLGRTSTHLWDVSRDPPALLAPGTRVRFVRA